MTLADLGVMAAIAVGLSGLFVGIQARAQASKLADSQAVKVIVDAAGDATELWRALFNESALNSSKTIADMKDRLAVIESKLATAEGQNNTLKMQLGKVKARVLVLEQFIRDLGHEPPNGH